MTVAEITPVGQDLVTEVSIEAQHRDHVHTGQSSRFKSISFFWGGYFLVITLVYQ